jgi:outer membrane receptor protein involved in Fe transport
MRQNAGDVDAPGIEGDLSWNAADTILLSLAFSYADARVENPGSALDGKRPAQAPRLSIDGSADWDVSGRIHLRGAVRWESSRFEDDLNTLPLASALQLDLSAAYKLTDAIQAAFTIENATDTAVETAIAADGTVSYGAPRSFTLQLRYTP